MHIVKINVSKRKKKNTKEQVVGGESKSETDVDI